MEENTPDIGSSELTSQELLVEQSEIPAISKKFTIETDTKILGDLDVTGTVTATSFVGDGSQLTGVSGGGGPQSEITSGESFARLEQGDPDGDSDAPPEIKMLSVGGDTLWDVEFEVLNDFRVDAADDIRLEAGDDIVVESINNTFVTAETGKVDIRAGDYIEMDGDVHLKDGHPLRLQDDFDANNPGMESFVQNLDAATSTGVPSALAVSTVTDNIQSQIDASQPLTARYPDVSPYYYIYVGEPAAKLAAISDLHYDYDEDYDFRYDQEFESLADAFKFVQESNFDSVAWSDWRTSWVKTRIVFVLQNGKVFGIDDDTSSYISLSHMKNHVVFTTQLSVDRDGTIDTSVTGYTYINYDVNFSYCPHIHMGGDIGWHWLQSNNSNLIRMWVNSYDEDVYIKNLWAIRGSHVYIDGMISELELEEYSYCKVNRIVDMPPALKTKLDAIGVNTGIGNAIGAYYNSTLHVETSFNSSAGRIRIYDGSKVIINIENDDMILGDVTDSNYRWTAIDMARDSELFINADPFDSNDASAMPNLVINTGTITQPNPETNNEYIKVDWSSKFSIGIPIDDTNATGVQVLDGEILVRPNLPTLP